MVTGNGRSALIARKTAPAVAQPTEGRLAKRLLDVGFSSCALVVSMPMWLLIVLAIRLEDRGPALYGQDRVGQRGRRFRALKFRSMVPNAESGGDAVQARPNDPRVTHVGRILRATALDELPQLWNILKGDMSFVGPRALRPGEIEVGGSGEEVPIEAIEGFVERSAVAPGLTGLAQIYAPRDILRRQKFRYDRLYIRKQSVWLDIRLILLSFWISVRGTWEHQGKKF